MKIKKILLIVMAVLLLLTCFTACDDGEQQKPANNEYEFLDKMLELNYSKITLTITNKFDEETSLVSQYVMSYSGETVTVDYTIERFNQISLDKPNTEVKYTITGQTLIKDGVSATVDDGNVVITPEIAEVNFSFKEEYFENAELTSLYLKANVKDANSFMQKSLTCNDMKVYAEFLDAFYQIKVNYTNENGTQVEYNYEFTL